MNRLPHAVTAVMVALFVGLLAAGPVPEAAARPQYKKSFDTLYKGKLKKTDCAICHPVENKKVHNDYGTALEDALDGVKNLKDAGKLKKALEKTGGKKSKDGEKTYKERIDAGLRPSTKS